MDTTTATLGGVALLQSLAALKSVDDHKIKSNIIGAAVCMIAYIHYEWMRKSNDKNMVNNLRYSDWFVTLPLLYYECAIISGISDNTEIVVPSVCLLLGMLVMGRLSTTNRFKRYKIPLLLIGFICLITCLVLFIMTATPSLLTSIVIFSMCTWFLYGVFAIWPDSNASTVGFSILDLTNKALFGFFVAMSSSFMLVPEVL